MAAPKRKRGVSVPPPARLDPVSGKPLQRGNPVPAAFSGSPADRLNLGRSAASGAMDLAFRPPDSGNQPRPAAPPVQRPYVARSTVQPNVGRVGRPSPFGNPTIRPQDEGRVADPVTGNPLRRGQPVAPAYSGGVNDRVNLGLQSAGRALGMGFGPPGGAPKRASLAAKRADGQPQPPSAPSAPSRSAMLGQSGSVPLAKGAAVNTNTLDSISRTKPNTPGYEPFPTAPKRKKKAGY